MNYQSVNTKVTIISQKDDGDIVISYFSHDGITRIVKYNIHSNTNTATTVDGKEAVDAVIRHLGR